MSTLESRIAAKNRGQGLAGTGVVAIWNSIREDLREDFMEWHPREHMVERLSIPGFLRGRRCIALDGGPEFLTLYELRNPEVLLSDVYRERLSNPTDWSASTLPGFTDNTRGACRILFTEGYAMGAFVLTIRIEPQPGRDAELIDALQREAMPRLVTLPRVTGAHLIRNDIALTGGNAGNQRGRVILLPDIIVMIEASNADAARRAGERLLSDALLTSSGAKPGAARGVYQLEYSIQALAK
jgi:hypothetical protein